MEIRQHSFTVTNPLEPVGPAANLFVSGASVFEITDFTPPLQRVTIVGINLPSPGIFGPFDRYVATLEVPDEQNSFLTSFVLQPTADRTIWAGTTFLDFGGTLPPMTVSVRPQLNDTRVGAVILQGPVFGEETGDEGSAIEIA